MDIKVKNIYYSSSKESKMYYSFFFPPSLPISKQTREILFLFFSFSFPLYL